MTRLWQTAAAITPHLKTRFETIDAESLASNRSTIEGGRILYPAMRYTFGKLNQGDSTPFIELVTRVGSGPVEKNDYYRQHYLKQFNYVLLKFIDAKFPIATPEQITSMRKASAAFLETMDCSSSGSEFGDQMRCQIVLAAMQDDQAGLAAWRGGLSEKELTDLKSIFKKQRAISANYLAKLLNVTAPKPVSDEVRWKAVSALLSDPWFQAAWADAPNGLILRPLLQRKMLTESQIKEKGESLIKLWPRRGKMASELAEWYMANQHPETAIHFADIGAKSAGPAFVKRLMLHKVNCLVDLKEYEKATELLDSIKESDLPNDLKNMRFMAAAKLKRNLEFDAK